jgi:hypothetical protein
MKTQNTKRVLSRSGARELTLKEIEHISGGVHTETLCSFNPVTRQPDGDVGEC